MVWPKFICQFYISQLTLLVGIDKRQKTLVWPKFICQFKNSQFTLPTSLCDHCKFGQTCKHMQTSPVCTIPNCNIKFCLGRHPRPCNFFTSSGFCKFGTECSFAHPQPVTLLLQIGIESPKASLQSVLHDLDQKESIIQDQK